MGYKSKENPPDPEKIQKDLMEFMRKLNQFFQVSYLVLIQLLLPHHCLHLD